MPVTTLTRVETCNRIIDEGDYIANNMLVSPDGTHLYVAGGDRVKSYRTHAEATPSPVGTTKFVRAHDVFRNYRIN